MPPAICLDVEMGQANELENPFSRNFAPQAVTYQPIVR